MKGREQDLQERQLMALPLPQLLRAVHGSGFVGLWIDRNFFKDARADAEKQISRELADQAPLVSADRRYSFFDLRSLPDH